jgi:hypothetical protein
MHLARRRERRHRHQRHQHLNGGANNRLAWRARRSAWWRASPTNIKSGAGIAAWRGATPSIFGNNGGSAWRGSRISESVIHLNVGGEMAKRLFRGARGGISWRGGYSAAGVIGVWRHQRRRNVASITVSAAWLWPLYGGLGIRQMATARQATMAWLRRGVAAGGCRREGHADGLQPSRRIQLAARSAMAICSALAAVVAHQRHQRRKYGGSAASAAHAAAAQYGGSNVGGRREVAWHGGVASANRWRSGAGGINMAAAASRQRRRISAGGSVMWRRGGGAK